jgi:hypothetical protein
MTHFVPRQDLNTVVAARIALPAVRRVAADVRDRVQRGAPDAKVWITRHDGRVRPSHREADRQEIPDNLRYLIPKVNTGNDLNDIRIGFDQARAPRDPSLPIGNRINCRCASLPLQGAIARAVRLDDAQLSGTRVSARVSVRFNRIVESEHPSDPDRGGGWFRAAVEETAAGLRAASHR